MELWASLHTKGLTPTRLWLRLDAETRMEAARALYAHDWDDDPVITEADGFIALALKSRPVAIKRMPFEQRAGYLAKVVRPERNLVSSLLLALHLHNRVPLMSQFLDHLQIPHENGLIDIEHEMEPVPEDKVEGAVEAVLKTNPMEQVDLYLVTIYMMDPSTWRNLPAVMRKRITADATE